MLIYSAPRSAKSSGSLYLRGAHITPLPEQGRGQVAGKIQTTITPSGNAEPLTVLHASMRLARQFHDPVSQKIIEMAAHAAADDPQTVTLQKIIMSYPDTFKYGDVQYLVTDQFGGTAALKKMNPNIRDEISQFLSTQDPAINADILFLPTPLGLGWDDNKIIKRVCENECFVRDETSGIVSLNLGGCIENITALLGAKMGMLNHLKQSIAILKATGITLDDILSNPVHGINSGALAAGHALSEDVRKVYQDMFDEAPDPEPDQGQRAGGRSRYKKSSHKKSSHKKSRKKRRSKGKNRSKKRTRMKKKIKRRTKK